MKEMTSCLFAKRITAICQSTQIYRLPKIIKTEIAMFVLAVPMKQV